MICSDFFSAAWSCCSVKIDHNGCYFVLHTRTHSHSLQHSLEHWTFPALTESVWTGFTELTNLTDSLNKWSESLLWLKWFTDSNIDSLTKISESWSWLEIIQTPTRWRPGGNLCHDRNDSLTRWPRWVNLCQDWNYSLIR